MIDTNLPRSTKRRGRTLTTVAATATAAALAFGFSAGPAFAEGATGKYKGDNAANGHAVSMGGSQINTTLFNLELDDGTVLKAYCIDYETSIRKGAKYAEDAWANYPGKGKFAEPAKVHWILQNSYPTVSVDELAKDSGIARLSEKDALAGTQAAIWHFSNDVELKGRNQPNVKKLYEYLVDNAEELPQTEEPEASLAISPKSAEGKAGETIGEFTVETSAESLPLELDAPEGVELVDLETGEAVENVGNGDTFGVQVPEGTDPGEATVSASVSTEVHAGRLFKGTEDKPTQTLITAETGEATVTDGIKVTWAEGDKPEPTPEPTEEPSEEPSPTPEPTEEPSPTPTGDDKPKPEKPEKPEGDDDKGGLPVTGVALGGLVAAAVAAVGGGGAAMYLSRKRRSAAADTTEE
ncbi:MAG: Cys-Gln thioester bond-forming surface protein [Nocardiopsaceae bacterium]|nr:Cys-Gln thioester bond-forming surface protein [Nocardiopsaceae bacterium]